MNKLQAAHAVINLCRSLDNANGEMYTQSEWATDILLEANDQLATELSNHLFDTIRVTTTLKDVLAKYDKAAKVEYALSVGVLDTKCERNDDALAILKPAEFEDYTGYHRTVHKGIRAALFILEGANDAE